MNLNRRDALICSGATIAAGALPASALAQSPAAPAAPTSAARQAPGFYRYKVGDIEVTAINDGFAERPLEGYVKNAALPDVEQHARQIRQPAGKVRVPYNTLVLRTGGKTVLIDAGNGDSGPPTTGSWMANFKAAGFDPASVDTVVFTHFHGDHINGLRLKSGEAVFPKAEIKVPAAEWAFWMDDAKMAAAPEAAQGAFRNVRRVFGPMAASVTRFEADKEVVPGVTAVAAYGHTPGHTVMAIASGNDRMLMMADLTNHTSFFLRNPDWHVLFDMNPEAAAQTRRRMAEMAVSERAQVAFYHAPFPATGYIEKAGSGFRLEPVQWS
jgi:glyoxylase-like metal-dependent hydrolase (beta-lactamase superfamily II)